MTNSWRNDFINNIDCVPIINGVGPATRLGGLPLSPWVLEMMSNSLKNNFRMEELHFSASRYLSDVLGVEAALITNGAAAALTLATATCLTKDDITLIPSIPNHETFSKNIVVPKNQRDPYDHALSMLGVKLKEIESSASFAETELMNSVDSNTIAGLWRAGINEGERNLNEFVLFFHERNLPVIVDAAVFVPPIERLHQIVDSKADFIAVSGGKGFRGPQASGLLICSKDNFSVTLLNHLDLDEQEETWNHTLFGRNKGDLPSNGVGRSMKVGREQIYGLLAAITEYRFGKKNEVGEKEIDRCKDLLAENHGIKVNKKYHFNLDTYYLEINTPDGLDINSFYTLLSQGDPRIILGQELQNLGFLTLNAMGLMLGEGEIVAERIARIYESAG